MASKNDIQLASLAAGFTLGFGFLTCWKAIKQTRQNRNPLRSVYIYMVWGEIAANLAIGIIGWLFLDGVLGPTVPVLFFILFLWVFEIQLLMQIIINRISVVAERRTTIQRLKWGTAAIITAINIAVFCIWIPAHTVPPVSKTYVLINEYWDRTSKVLILLVDAGLNWYFLRTVKARLVDHHGLTKYAPLVSFNAKLMVVSIGMDAMLIGLMSLPNQVVYIQFHPVTYMVKLNIEMSMASLITRLARGEPNNDQNIDFSSLSYSNGRNQRRHQESNGAHHGEVTLQSFRRATIVASPSDEAVDTNIGRAGIHRRMEVEIKSEYCAPNLTNKPGFDSDRDRSLDRVEDEQSLTRNAGHPTGAQKKDLSDSDETSRWEYAGSRDS